MNKHIWRKLKSIRNKVIELANKETVNYYAYLQIEQSMLSKRKSFVKKKSRLRHNYLRQVDDWLEEIEQCIYNAAQSKYMEMRSEFDFPLSFEELIGRQDLFEMGLNKLLQQSGLYEETLEKYFDYIIPSHPKDEHIEVRGSKRKFYIHAGPTNSGKTYESMQRLKNSNSGMYLAPLRLLAIENYEYMNMDGIPCSLMTGEEQISVPGSLHTSMTVEMADLKNEYDVVVLDEAQMVNDMARGNAWVRAILGVNAKEIHICCSTNAIHIITRMIEDCGDDFDVVQHERNVPLIVEDEDFYFPEDVQEGDALVVFSKRKVMETANTLENAGIEPAVIYGKLPPETRRKQVEMLASGERKVVVTTDAIGMGLNLPIRRVIFLDIQKFDGNHMRDLTEQEVKQIAGRAGRRGIYKQGYVNTTQDKAFVKDMLFKKDKKIREVYLRPMKHTILDIGLGTIDERLKQWLSYKPTVEYFRKSDVSQQLLLMQSLNYKTKKGLSEEELYQVSMVPFDYGNETLFQLWKDYVNEGKQGNSFTKPKLMEYPFIDKLEVDYQKLDLYYYFHLIFGEEPNMKWINDTRTLIAERIHQLLVENAKK